jgi:hypothetical protein
VAFDVKKLDKLDWGVLAAGGIAFIALFLPWYGASVGGFSATVSGWSAGYGLLGALLLIAAAVFFLLLRAEVNLPKLPVTPLIIILAASALGLLLVVIRWISLPRGGGGVGGLHYSYGGRVGIWIEVVAGVVEVVSAVLLFRKSGESLPKFGSSSQTNTPPAPPAA